MEFAEMPDVSELIDFSPIIEHLVAIEQQQAAILLILQFFVGVGTALFVSLIFYNILKRFI